MSLESERLILSEFSKNDAPFFFELVNDPAWIQYIGDRNINTTEDAEKYLEEKIIPSYQEFGFGFYIVRLKKEKTPIGMCGLIKRDWMKYVDIGYAFLPGFRGKGYALEAGKATMKYAKETLQISKLAAITDVNNSKSSNLLERLGLEFDRLITYPNETEKSKLYLEK
jgi:RimJ/RimL family protein N-acetyltransferase